MTKLAVITARYLQYCQFSKNLSCNTVRAYEQDLKSFARFLGDEKALSEVSSESILSYVEVLFDRQGAGPATVRRRIACLRGFFQWSVDSSELACSPMKDLNLPIRQPKRLPKVVDRSVLRKLLQGTRTDRCTSLALDSPFDSESHGQVDPQNLGVTTYLAILIMTVTGIRVSELVGIQINDVSISDCTIRIHGKGSRDRTVYINNDTLMRSLRAYIAARKGCGTAPLLVNVQGSALTPQAVRLRLRRLCERTTTEKHVTPHMLRHTAATMLIEEGLDIRFLQKLLGHQSISTTEIYTHISDSSLKAALKAADPLARI